MIRYVLRRLPSALLVLFVASIVVFFVLRLAPGDPALTLAGADADEATVQAIREELGLTEPLPIQYLSWLRSVVTGDLGTSYVLHAPVADLIARSLINTLELTVAALVLALAGGGLLGFILGTSRRRAVQTVVGALTSVAFAVPTYVTGVLLTLVFAVSFRLLPAGGNGGGLSDFSDGWRYLVLPAISLSLPTGATIARFVAASMRRTLDEDFVQTGIAKGLPPRRLMFGHVLPNSMPPVLTILGIQIGQLLGGAVIVETIFAWPGIGQLLLQSVIGRDYLLTQALLLIAVLVFVVVQIVTDVVDAAIDPRIRLERI